MKFLRRQRPMACPEVGRLLQHYLDGVLDDRDTTRLRAHLEDCRRCGMELEVYAQIKASLARRGEDLPVDAISRLRAFGEQLKNTDPPGGVMNDKPRPAVPPWSTPLEAAQLIARGVTYRTASRVSLVVGTILSTVNQGSVIAHGDATAATWIRVVVNYLVPYTVASIGYLSPFRVTKKSTTDTRTQ